jgi:Raf kinase inhibitor-like YbhB/YbcL family protein
MEVTLYGSSSKISVPSRSIPIAVQNPPKQAVCLALTMIDPDGNDWVHWLAVNIPVGDLKENASIDQADEFVQGTNSFGFIGYGGPTPPTGVHTYVTTVYALSGPVDLEDGFLEEELMAAIEGLVIDSCVLEGDYAS